MNFLNLTLSKTKHKTEAQFTTAYLKEFKKNWWSYKISDSGAMVNKNAKPFDWFGLCEHWVVFCEVKKIQWIEFNLGDIRASQRFSLRAITNLSKKYKLDKFIHPTIMIYSINENKYKIIRYDKIIELIDWWIEVVDLDFNKV